MKKITWTGKDKLEYTEDAQFSRRPLVKNEVLIKIDAVGLCSTDVHIIMGKLQFKTPPHVLGHEISGTVIETGAGVTRVKIGDRVTGDSVVGCGECSFCRNGATQFCKNGYEIGMTVDGGMQEYLYLPERNVFPIPDSISDAESAILDVEIFGALSKPGIEKGDTVMIIGPGPGGLIAVQIAKNLGAGRVILAGTREERLSLGKKLGADITLNSSSGDVCASVMDITGGNGADIVFDAAGTDSSAVLATDAVRAQGKVILYGVHGSPVESFDLDKIVLKDMVVYGSLSNRTGWETVILWVAEGKLCLKDIITHRFSFSDAQKAYETVRDRKDGAIKAVLIP